MPGWSLKLSCALRMPPVSTAYPSGACNTMALIERGTCALCGAIIYEDDSGAVVVDGALFCTQSCADEAQEV